MTVFWKRSRYLIIILLAALFFSCSARIDGVLREGGAANLTLKTALEPATFTLLRSIMGFMREEGEKPVLDGEAIGRSISSAPGIRSVSLKNTSSASIEGSISLTNVGDFLALKDGSAKSRFITYTEGRTTGSSSITIRLDKASAPEIISMLSPEVEDYLSVLMAPVVLGDTSTKQEYLDLLASIYGRPLSNEIAEAKIRVFIEFPRPVTAVRGGTATGKQAEFSVPLLDILVLEQALQYQIYW